MNTQFEQYIKKAKGVAMKAEERSKILGNLNVMMENSLLKDNISGQVIRSPYFFHFTFQKVLVFALVAVFLLTTGSSFAAENALPGDALYPIKINVNEEVKGFFAVSPAAKAGVNAEIALTRLQEAETLQAEGRLDDKSRSDIESNFEVHAANVKANLSASSSDADYEKTLEVANSFESSLNAHKEVFAALSAQTAETESSDKSQSDTTKNNEHILFTVSKVANDLTNATSSVAVSSRLGVTAEGATEAKIIQKLNAVGARISAAEIYVNGVKIDAGTKEKALSDIGIAKDLTTEAKIKIEQKSYKEAFLLLTNANNFIGKIYSYIKVENEANIQLNGRVNINTGQAVDLNKGKNIIINVDPADAGSPIDSSVVSSSTISVDKPASNQNSNLNADSVSSSHGSDLESGHKFESKR